MTVNIGLITSEALVLGCDSVASTSKPFLDPMSLPWELDSNGVPLEEDGKYTLKFNFGDFEQVVTSAWGGVTKMFQIHPNPSPVVAVSAGLANLEERSIASHAQEFFRERKSIQSTPGTKGTLVKVETIGRAFLRFMRRRYDAHYRDSQLPDHLKEGPEFLVGGIGRDDPFPSLYRVSVQWNDLQSHFSGGACGIAWNGQADAVERFIRGFDNAVRSHVEDAIRQAFEEHGTKTQTYITDLVNGILDKLNQPLPEGTKIEAPKVDAVGLSWEQFAIPIDYSNLPLQEAVNECVLNLVGIEVTSDLR